MLHRHIDSYEIKNFTGNNGSVVFAYPFNNSPLPDEENLHMYKRLAPKSWCAAIAAASLSLTAVNAFAECDEVQEAMVGKAIAAASAAKISAVVPATGKQMVNIESCADVGAALVAEFKYNLIGADGLYWASGRIKVSGKDVKELTFLKLSPNLASASDSKGVKLASN